MYWIYVIYCCLSCSGVLKLSSTFCESLADADAAALMRLRFARKVTSAELEINLSLCCYSLETGSKPFGVLSKALPTGEPNKGIISLS